MKKKFNKSANCRRWDGDQKGKNIDTQAVGLKQIGHAAVVPTPVSWNNLFLQ